MSEKQTSRRVPSDVWKWLTAVLFSVAMSMGGYILTVEDQIKQAIRAEYTTMNAPILQRIESLERSRDRFTKFLEDDESRLDQLERNDERTAAALDEIKRNQARIMAKLDALQ